MGLIRDLLSALRTGEGLRGALVRGTAGMAALKVASTALAVLSAIVLARALGPDNYGHYSLALSLVALLALPGSVGLPTLVMRETAASKAVGRWDLMRGMLRWANLFVAATTLAVGGAAVAALLLLGDRLDAELSAAFWWSLPLLFLLCLGALRAGTLRGLGHVVIGQVPEGILLPLVKVILVAVAWGAAGARLSAWQGVAFHTAAAGAAFLLGWAILLRRFPPQARSAEPRFESRAWIRSLIPLALLGGIEVLRLQIGVVLLGAFSAASEIAQYRVAWSAAALVTFPLGAVNAVLAPHFAALWATGETGRLQRVLTAGARGAVLLAIPPAILLIAFGTEIVTLLLGKAYAGAAVPAAILSVGHLLNGFGGLAGGFLNMTGGERSTLVAGGVGAALSIALGAALIPPLGALGAAAASAAGLLAGKLILILVARSRGFDSTVLGLRPRT